jgi:hypothetical protein
MITKSSWAGARTELGNNKEARCNVIPENTVMDWASFRTGLLKTTLIVDEPWS